MASLVAQRSLPKPPRKLFEAVATISQWRPLYFLHTLHLFTYSDWKTIVIPVSVFAAVAAPVASPVHFVRGVSWIWLHLLQSDLANQYTSVAEDARNKPWRPLPAGRISRAQATVLRWALLAICTAASLPLGRRVLAASVAFSAMLVVYNELQLAVHWFWKNVINIGGYAMFEVGATLIMGQERTLDRTALLSLAISSLVICTTIQMQDFPDVRGDAAQGRVTLPLRFPEGARVCTALGVVLWSVVAVEAWSLALGPSAAVCVLGWYVGWRNYALRDEKEDAKTYVIFNLWLFIIHLLPVNGRSGILASR